MGVGEGERDDEIPRIRAALSLDFLRREEEGWSGSVEVGRGTSLEEEFEGRRPVSASTGVASVESTRSLRVAA